MFKTHDSQLASVLIWKKQKFKTSRVRSKVLFEFNDEKRAKELVNNFFNGEYPDIDRLLEAQRIIKKIIVGNL